MCSVERLREFVNERLTAAAEEIFGVFQNTIVEYEEEIYRQRKLLDIVWKPEIKLHRIDLQQQHVCKEEEEEVLTDQELCYQESNSSLDQEDPEPLQIKEEQEELCSSQQGEEVLLTVDAATCMVTPTDEERDHVKPELDSDHQLLLNNFYAAESQDQKGYKHEDSTRDAESEQNNQQHENKSHSNILYNPNSSEIASNSHKGKPVFKCDTCGKDFKKKSSLYKHARIHTGEKLYICKHEDSTRDAESEQNNQQHENRSHSNIVYNPTLLGADSNIHPGKYSLKCDMCGKHFKNKANLRKHATIHTVEKPWETCGKRFATIEGLRQHQKIHTGEKPHICTTCGKAFTVKGNLKVHIRLAHTSERPYLCKMCGKGFIVMSALKMHQRIHTGEKPYICTLCGKAFAQNGALKVHIRHIHTGEKPYTCTICGKAFAQNGALKVHIRHIHTGEKPYTCTICGKAFAQNGALKVHIRKIHTGDRPYSKNLKMHMKIHTGQ